MLGASADENNIDEVSRYCKIVQIFTHRKNEYLLNDEYLEKLKDLDVYVHSTFNCVLTHSYTVKYFLEQYKTCSEYGFKGIVLHTPRNITNIDKTIRIYMEAIKQFKYKPIIYIEHTVGDYCHSKTFLNLLNHIRNIAKKIDDSIIIGGCIDTCHIFSSKYPIEDFYDFNYDEIIVHLNDSMNAINSGLDRHADIGTNIFTDKEDVEYFMDNVKAKAYIIELKNPIESIKILRS